jgi:hypothetical protein
MVNAVPVDKKSGHYQSLGYVHFAPRSHPPTSCSQLASSFASESLVRACGSYVRKVAEKASQLYPATE